MFRRPALRRIFIGAPNPETLVFTASWLIIVIITLGMFLLPWTRKTFSTAMILVLLVVALDVVFYMLYKRGLPFQKTTIMVSAIHTVFAVLGLFLTGGLDSPFRPLLTVIIVFFAAVLPFRWGMAAGVGIILSFAVGHLLVFGMTRLVELFVFASFDFITLLVVSALASRSDILRTRFLHIAAHELRNPLAAIKGVCSLVHLQLVSGKPTEEISHIAEMGVREADRLSLLLNEILEAFLVREGQLPLKRERVSLVNVISSALQPFQLSDGTHRLSVEGVEDDTVYILGDFRRLEEVVRNLTNNAVKYSPADGMVRLRLGVTRGWAVIQVSDEGFGIPKDELLHVFEPFHRASNLAGRDPGGMGLGLYICKEIVEHHKGHIWAESDEGKGTTFHVELPLHP